MVTVSKFVKEVKQPLGGYLPINMWKVKTSPINIVDDQMTSQKMYMSQGLVVEYLTQIMYEWDINGIKPITEQEIQSLIDKEKERLDISQNEGLSQVQEDFAKKINLAKEKIDALVEELPALRDKSNGTRSYTTKLLKKVKSASKPMNFKESANPTYKIAETKSKEYDYVFLRADVGSGIQIYLWDEIKDMSITHIEGVYWIGAPKFKVTNTTSAAKKNVMSNVLKPRWDIIEKTMPITFVNSLHKYNSLLYTYYGDTKLISKEWMWVESLNPHSLKTKIYGLDDESIKTMFLLVQWDDLYRAGRLTVNTTDIVPSPETCANVRAMVNAGVEFLKQNSVGLYHGGVFSRSAYSDVITNGDYDFSTNTKIIDFKTSKYPPTKEHTLQVLIYYLLGNRGKYDADKVLANVTTLSIFNPRLNAEWTLDVKDIPIETLNRVKEITHLN